MKEFLYIFSRLSRNKPKFRPQRGGNFVRLFPNECARRLGKWQITLGANEKQERRVVCVRLLSCRLLVGQLIKGLGRSEHLVLPAEHIGQRAHVGHVENEQRRLAAPVVGVCDAPEALEAGRVPNLQRVSLAENIEALQIKVNANGRLVGARVDVVPKSIDQARFAHCNIAAHNHLAIAHNFVERRVEGVVRVALPV